MQALLTAAADLSLPNWYLGAGSVAQTVWNLRHDFEPDSGIKDYDLVYFDRSNLSADAVRRVEGEVARLLPEGGVVLDVQNEARVHLWYEERFGRHLQPYGSTEEAIATWPTTASSVGVREDHEGFVVCAPFGLSDLLGMVARPNKTIVSKDVYEEKVLRWAARWPRLQVIRGDRGDAMTDERLFPAGSRVDDLDLSSVHLHGANFEGAKLTDAYLCGADISGDIEGVRVNGVAIEPLVTAELDRRFPERRKLRSTDIEGLRDAWSLLEERWAATTERAYRLPEDAQSRRIDGEWSVVETLRHLIFATDCWLFRAIRMDRHPYHPWGLPWTGAETNWAREVGLDLSATPTLDEVVPVRRQRQQAVRATLHDLTDGELADVRTAPDDPGHPNGGHSVLHCFHVLCNEEWEHHRYTLRDLDVLERTSPPS